MRAATPTLVMPGLVPGIQGRQTPGHARGLGLYSGEQANGTLYVGVTSNLRRRMEEHRRGLIEGFTKRYGVKFLVWAERHESIASAIQREKTIKKYSRRWKLNLIERLNPQWRDLSETWDVFE